MLPAASLSPPHPKKPGFGVPPLPPRCWRACSKGLALQAPPQHAAGSSVPQINNVLKKKNTLQCEGKETQSSPVPD